MEKNYAINRTNSNKELTHWKYIKRIKGPNGKWKYYYDDPYARSKNRTLSIETTSLNDEGKQISRKTNVTYKDTNKLFSGTSKLTMGSKDNSTINTVHERGQIERSIAKGEKWILDNILNKRGDKR